MSPLNSLQPITHSHLHNYFSTCFNLVTLTSPPPPPHPFFIYLYFLLCFFLFFLFFLPLTLHSLSNLLLSIVRLTFLQYCGLPSSFSNHFPSFYDQSTPVPQFLHMVLFLVSKYSPFSTFFLPTTLIKFSSFIRKFRVEQLQSHI